MAMNMKEMFRSFNEAVNETALAKSKFYDQVIDEIKSTVSREKPRLDSEGNPIEYETEILIHDLEGNVIVDSEGKPVKHKIKVPVMQEVTIDDMVAGIYSLGSRGSKINKVPDSFIIRIGRGATYARILANSKIYKHHTNYLQELIRQDVERVVKIIEPDLTKVSMPVHQKLSTDLGKPETTKEEDNLKELFK